MRFGKAPESWSDCGRPVCDKTKPGVCLIRWSKAPVLSVCHRAGEAAVNSSARPAGLRLCSR